jgi:hypothetical protein
LQVKHYGLDSVADLVLKACLHDQAYDPQSESSKARWLFDMFNNTRQYSKFSEAIISGLKRKRETWDLQQLFELAEEMAKNGDDNAREAVRERAFKKASKASMDDWLGAIEWVHLTGIEGALDIARIYGRRLMSDPYDFIPDTVFTSDEISSDFQTQLLKLSQNEPKLSAYQNYLEKQGSLDTFTSQSNNETKKLQASESRAQLFNLATILSNAKNKVGDYPVQYTAFGRCATPEEREIVLSQLVQEEDDDVRLRLLWVFGHSPLPRIPPAIFKWAENKNGSLYTAAIRVLAESSDPRIHELAKTKITSDKLLGIQTAVLQLFINNYESDDAKLIERALFNLKPGKEDAHALVWTLTDIAKQQKDAGLTDSLKWAYDKTPCAECRHKLVIQLDALNEFKGDILDECQFDANEDIYMLAKIKLAESR